MTTMIDALVARYHPVMFQSGHAAEHARKARAYLGGLAKVLNVKVPWTLPASMEPQILQGLINVNMQVLSTITDSPEMRRYWIDTDPNGIIGQTAEVVEGWVRAKGVMRIDPRMADMRKVGTRKLPDGTVVDVIGFPPDHDLHPNNSMPATKKTAGAPAKTEKDPWDEGYEAYEAEYALAANPYRPGGRKHDKWKGGWQAARDKDTGAAAEKPEPGLDDDDDNEVEASKEEGPKLSIEVQSAMSGSKESVETFLFTCEDALLLKQIREVEQLRRRGPRAYVVSAIDARLEALDAAA